MIDRASATGKIIIAVVAWLATLGVSDADEVAGNSHNSPLLHDRLVEQDAEMRIVDSRLPMCSYLVLHGSVDGPAIAQTA